MESLTGRTSQDRHVWQPAALVVLLVAACGGGDSDASVSGAWARATAPGATVGAVYFDVEAPDDDTLLGVSVPADVAARAELHAVVPADMGDTDMGDTDMGDTDMGDMGAVRMRELTGGLALVGGEPVSFDPGGDHVMLPELVGALEVGDEFELTLDFQNADDVTVAVDVAETAP